MSVRLFLCGDVMTGRGIDQVLPHPVEPHLFESWARSASAYAHGILTVRWQAGLAGDHGAPAVTGALDRV